MWIGDTSHLTPLSFSLFLPSYVQYNMISETNFLDQAATRNSMQLSISVKTILSSPILVLPLLDPTRHPPQYGVPFCIMHFKNI